MPTPVACSQPWYVSTCGGHEVELLTCTWDVQSCHRRIGAFFIGEYGDRGARVPRVAALTEARHMKLTWSFTRVLLLAILLRGGGEAAGAVGAGAVLLCARARAAFAPAPAMRPAPARRSHRRHMAVEMGPFDPIFELRREQKAPLRPPAEFELWLDVRPPTVGAVSGRHPSRGGRQGGPATGRGWEFPAESRSDNAAGGRLPRDGAAEDAARVMAGLYARLRERGPLLRKCSPGPPVQGLVFDYRNAPSRAVGDLPLITVLRHGALADSSGDEVGRDLRVSNPMSMLAEAERHFGQARHIFVEDVMYGERPVLRPMLIHELCARGSEGARAQQTQILTSVKNIQDLTEGVLLLQYREDFLRGIGGDRDHIEDLRNKRHISEEDYAEIERLGLLPPLLDAEADATTALDRLLDRKTQEGRDELLAQYKADAKAKADSPWQQTSLFPETPREAPIGDPGEAVAVAGGRESSVRHVLVLPPDGDLWAAALALRAGDMWGWEPIEPLSLLFPKERGGRV